MVENIGDPGSQSSGDVLNAIQTAFDTNNPPCNPPDMCANLDDATYVGYDHVDIGPVTSSGDIPAEAGGVRTVGSREFTPYIASLAGINSMTAGAQAMAMAGVLQGTCVGCAFLPVTFPVKVRYCDGTNRSVTLGTDWVEVPLDTALSDSTGRWEAILPLCKNGPGDVGWLDFKKIGQAQTPPVDCGNNLQQWVYPGCTLNMPVPDWYPAEAGNVNAPEGELNQYMGKVVMIPLFDGECRVDPSPSDCAPGDTGRGSNFWYHIPKVAAFLLDEAFVQGGNNPDCNSGPGYPYVGGNGSTGCLKGWFIDLVSLGQVGGTSGSGGDPGVLGVQLVK